MCYQIRFFLCILLLILLSANRNIPGEQSNEISAYKNDSADHSILIPELCERDS